MKCPFCQQELSEFAGTVDCVNIDCIKTRGWYGNKKLWQELITTRKALDKAMWWLNEIVENHRFTPISTAEKALAEIKDNDKDVK